MKKQYKGDGLLFSNAIKLSSKKISDITNTIAMGTLYRMFKKETFTDDEKNTAAGVLGTSANLLFPPEANPGTSPQDSDNPPHNENNNDENQGDNNNSSLNSNPQFKTGDDHTMTIGQLASIWALNQKAHDRDAEARLITAKAVLKAEENQERILAILERLTHVHDEHGMTVK